MSGGRGMQENVEPNVIDIKMIEKALHDDFPTGEVGRLTNEEGVTFEEVKKINLEFLDILRIDCLWMLTHLSVLQLACNRIEKIEGLDSLTTLVELDLSFNNIEVIENISTLINLEAFALFQNKISVLQNMEALQKLIIFNIGENCIEDLNSVIYLRQFPDLHSLNMAGNPCVEMEEEGGFRQYVCAFLPDLTYYEYRTILKEERAAANETYRDDLAKLKDAESDVLAKKSAAIKRVKEIEFQKTAFIEELDGDYFFEAMFKHDPEGKAFLKIDASKEPYEKFHDEMVVCLKQIFQLGLEKHASREEEIKQYKDCVRAAQEKNRVESTVIMGEFIKEKADIFFEIRSILKKVDELSVSEAEEEMYMLKLKAEMKELAHKFSALAQETWYNLMGKELILFEQMDEINGNFERNLSEMVGTFVEGAQGIFAQMRNLQQDYSEEITDVANSYLNQTVIDKSLLKPGLVKIMADKDSVNTATQSSHDIHMRVIDNREDLLCSRIHSWCDNMCKNIVRDEVKRNRNKVTEINNFLDLQKEEFEELQTLPLEESVEELPLDMEGEGEYEPEEEIVQQLQKQPEEEGEEEEGEGDDMDDMDDFDDMDMLGEDEGEDQEDAEDEEEEEEGDQTHETAEKKEPPAEGTEQH